MYTCSKALLLYFYCTTEIFYNITANCQTNDDCPNDEAPVCVDRLCHRTYPSSYYWNYIIINYSVASNRANACICFESLQDVGLILTAEQEIRYANKTNA